MAVTAFRVQELILKKVLKELGFEPFPYKEWGSLFERWHHTNAGLIPGLGYNCIVHLKDEVAWTDSHSDPEISNRFRTRILELGGELLSADDPRARLYPPWALSRYSREEFSRLWKEATEPRTA